MRYLLLVALNLPIVIFAFIDIFTKFKLGSVTRNQLTRQVLVWSIIFIVIVGAFPIYNALNGNHPLDSSKLTLIDIVQTTVITYFIYISWRQTKKVETLSKRLKKLHQELSIRDSIKK